MGNNWNVDNTGTLTVGTVKPGLVDWRKFWFWEEFQGQATSYPVALANARNGIYFIQVDGVLTPLGSTIPDGHSLRMSTGAGGAGKIVNMSAGCYIDVSYFTEYELGFWCRFRSTNLQNVFLGLNGAGRSAYITIGTNPGTLKCVSTGLAPGTTDNIACDITTPSPSRFKIIFRLLGGGNLGWFFYINDVLVASHTAVGGGFGFYNLKFYFESSTAADEYADINKIYFVAR